MDTWDNIWLFALFVWCSMGHTANALWRVDIVQMKLILSDLYLGIEHAVSPPEFWLSWVFSADIISRGIQESNLLMLAWAQTVEHRFFPWVSMFRDIRDVMELRLKCPQVYFPTYFFLTSVGTSVAEPSVRDYLTFPQVSGANCREKHLSHTGDLSSWQQT